MIRVRGKSVPEDVVQKVRTTKNVKLLEVADRMLRVEGVESEVRRVAPEGALVFAEDQSYELPTTDPKIKGK